MLIKELTEVNGVSGNEAEVRSLILAHIRELCDDIKVDTIGNIIAFKKGKLSTKKVMLSAHMDEVGFIAKGVTDGGYIKFDAVGGVDTRILPGKRVYIGKDKYLGVIGVKAIHLQTKPERNNALKISDLYIDIGAQSKEEALEKAPPGEYIAFDSEFMELGGNRLKAKALDDRIGCAVLIELLKNSYPYDLYACFTVQEEVGLRGAKVAGYRLQPDIALIIEGTTCADTYETEPKDEVTTLGGGAVLSIMERTSYSDRQLVSFISDIAKKKGIKHQYKRTTLGGNDAGAIQIAGTGVKTAVISVPCRYIHSPVCVMDKGDYQAALNLAYEFLNSVEAI